VKLTYADLSSAGPRPQNEDCLLFWEPEAEREKEAFGSIALVADGLGGHDAGEVASRLAVTTVLDVFRKSDPRMTSNQLLWRAFTEANLAVYDAGMHAASATRMATTLTVSLFRNNEVAIGHVGDSRAYLVRQGQIKQLTSDHTYVALQMKMNLISKEEAMSSDLRTMLTRSIGQNPTVQVDYKRLVARDLDTIIQCSDGLHVCVTDHELRDSVNRMPPADACDYLVRLAEKRGGQDNISVQVVRIESVPRVGYYRGAVAYSAPAATAAPATQDLAPGSLLDERFQITGVIHRSAMSTVFKGTDLKTGRPVAIKVPLPGLEGDPAAYARFEREEAIGRTLDHPSILKILPIEDSEKSRPYLVMELLDGQTLERLMQQIRPMPEADALPIVSQICDGLQYLHSQGVVHRDLKPQNIMLCSDGSLRIMDFGIAKAAATRRITFGGFSPTMGTPDYMAPEQVKGQRGDERTDIYSLGAILYEMLTGHVPFEGQNAYMIMNARLVGDPVAPRVLNPAIQLEVEEIVLRAMARDPAERYQSAADMKAAVDAPETVEITGRASRLQRSRPWKRQWRRLRMAALGILIPVVLFYLFFLMFSHRR
jgi:serine/threonine-protein kinase